MKPDFYEGLDAACLRLEVMLNRFRTPETYETFKKYAEKRQPVSPLLTPVDATKLTRKPAVSDKGGRVVLYLDDGYVCKTTAAETRTENLFCLATYSMGRRGSEAASASYFREEKNREIFEKYGITTKNGFYVPEHRVIGLHIVEGQVRVNREGTGITITEDLTEGGLYAIRDVQPYDFWQLRNATAFLEEYKRHMDALMGLHNNPNIVASVNRHGASADPSLSLSRMLLAKIEDNIGALIIGDLDNLAFEEKTPQAL